MEALMTRHSVAVLLALFTAASFVAPAWAQKPAATDSAKKPAHDPNEIICEDLFIGTKVNKKRYCATRAEWEARKQEDRAAVEEIQRPRNCSVMTRRC